MKRNAKILTALATTSAVCLGAGIPAVWASPQWVNTTTQGLTLNEATLLGALPADTPLQVSLVLRLHNQDALQKFIRGVNTPGNPSYGHYLTPQEFTERFGPTQGEVDQVTQYLQNMGFTDIEVSPNRMIVTARGTADQVSNAFHTRLDTYSQHGRIVYANSLPAHVPALLGPIVGAVLGLNNAACMTPYLKRPTAANAVEKTALPIVKTAQGALNNLTALLAPGASLPNYPASYNPQGFQKAYDVGTTPTGSMTAIAIFTAGDVSQTLKDLKSEEAANNLPQVPLTVVQAGIQGTDTSGVPEWDMDTQYSTGMAQTVSHLYLYNATSLTDSDLTLAFNKFVTDNVAKAASASFGEGEWAAFLDGAMLADDQIFAEAAAQGQTVFASAGDTGGFSPILVPTNGIPIGVPDVNYPASSPYVVAVGGTTLFTNSDGTYNNEIAWLAGGGGQSVWEAAPGWQSGVVPGTAVGKGLPDISMDADPNSGAEVYVNGQVQVYGGTSLSSPLALGVWARLESAHSNQLGFAPPLFYAKAGSAGFHDIILGDNGPYPALPGWDYATGLGTIDVSQMNAIIGK
jgi:pseudomonalisin